MSLPDEQATPADPASTEGTADLRVVLGVIAGVVVFVVIAALFMWRRHRRYHGPSPAQAGLYDRAKNAVHQARLRGLEDDLARAKKYYAELRAECGDDPSHAGCRDLDAAASDVREAARKVQAARVQLAGTAQSNNYLQRAKSWVSGKLGHAPQPTITPAGSPRPRSGSESSNASANDAKRVQEATSAFLAARKDEQGKLAILRNYCIGDRCDDANAAHRNHAKSLGEKAKAAATLERVHAGRGEIARSIETLDAEHAALYVRESQASLCDPSKAGAACEESNAVEREMEAKYQEVKAALRELQQA